MIFNEDIKINGVLTAALLDGELSPNLETVIDTRIRSAVLPLSQELEMQSERVATQALEITELREHNCELANRLNEFADKYNKAIEVINALAERVGALEANYDPTIIK